MDNDPSMREAMSDGARLVGSFVTMPSPTVAEVMALGGFDFLIVDIEHTGMSGTEVLTVLQATAQIGPKCLVRVGENSEMQIKQVLDAGADGIVVPHVQSKEDAERAVRYAKYPPLGHRGVTAARAARYGESFEEYIGVANQRLAVVALIEDESGLEDIDQIVGVEGIDAIFIGPWDLAGSIGSLGDTESPVVQDAIDKIIDAGVSAGKPIVIYIEDGRDADRWISKGVQVFVLGEDYALLSSKIAEQLRAVREAMRAA